MSRARLYAAAVAFLLALLLARVAFAPGAAPSATLAVPAVPAVPADAGVPADAAAPDPYAPGAASAPDDPPAPDDPFAASYDGPSPPPAPPGAPGPAPATATGAAPPGAASPAAASPGDGPAGASPPAAAAPAAATGRPPTAAEVRDALARLDAARAAAYAAPADGDPDTWAARTCACHRDDTERLLALARDGLVLRGHGVTVESVAFAAPPSAARARLVLADRASAYAAVDAAGRTVARWPASGPRRWHVTLVAISGRWLLGELARAP